MARKRRIIATLDAETDPFKQDRLPAPFTWGMYCGENELGVEEYLQWGAPDADPQALTKEVAEFFRDKKWIVYAHNGGKFDYHFLRDEINSDEPVMVINGRLAKFRIGDCEFRDSLNIFPNTRLKDFGGKLEIDYEKMERTNRGDPNNWAEISKYLRVDCADLWRVVDRYRREYGHSLTQASASMKYWEKMYGIEAPRQTKAQHDRYKRFYYGGRVQCFESGVSRTDFSVADINSAYPFAMLRSHPICTEGQYLDRLPDSEKKIEKCLVKIDATSRGALPWRDPESRELYFPDDEGGHRHRTRCYTVTGWELLAGLEQNAIDIQSVREVHYFPQTVDFQRYIEHFYGQREEARIKGDVAGRIFGKYFMNSLYGKFGANPEKYCEYVIATEDTYTQWMLKGYRYCQPWGERFLMERAPTEEDLQNEDGKKWRFYNVATAASVTGFVRAQLFRALSTCSGAIYCDTDSIAARDTTRLEFGSRLGQWKHEGAFDQYAIAGKKLYAFHHDGAESVYDPLDEKHPTWKIASKGVNFASRTDGPDIIARIAQGEALTFHPEIPTYSVNRETAVFIPRTLRRTAKDISIAPESLVA